MAVMRTKVALEKRKEIFLRVLAETGSVAAATTAATPGAQPRGNRAPGGSSTFYQLRQRDPRFAEAWERAIATALGKVETEVMRRAMTPTRRPVFSKGELVATTEEYDNRLLVALARRLDPEGWGERSTVEHRGEVVHRLAPGAVVLMPDDISLLPAAKRDALYELLEALVLRKQDQERREREASRLVIEAEAEPTALPSPEADDDDR